MLLKRKVKDKDMSRGLCFARIGSGSIYRSAIGQRMPVEHPRNCRTECPYGFGRAFCFPCMAKIMGEFRDERKRPDDEGMICVPVI